MSVDAGIENVDTLVLFLNLEFLVETTTSIDY